MLIRNMSLMHCALEYFTRVVFPGQSLTSEQSLALRDLSISCMTAYKGSLWVGTSNGFVLTLPLPRLEGVPQIKGDTIALMCCANMLCCGSVRT